MSLQNCQQRILENCIIIWLDLNVNQYDVDVQHSVNELQRVANSIKIFAHADQCIDYLTDIKNEKAFMIVSGSIDQQFMSLIQDIPQLYAIYVFCAHPRINEWRTEDYRKLKGVFNEIEPLRDLLNQDVHQADINWIPIGVISKTAPIDLNQLDQSFMYSQLLKAILLKMEYDEKAKEEFIEFCLEQYIENERTIQVIGEFERDYDRPSPIWWYTRDCFIYSMFNKALRTQDIEIILKMGFFLRDLHQQIQHLHSNIDKRSQLTVYRGQGMFNVEFEKLIKNEGGLLSFNSFLSTTIDRDIAYVRGDSSRDDPEMTGVFFELQIDPSISTIPFALLDDVSAFSDSEKEILFSMHTVFRINEVQQIDNRRFWKVKLTLTNDNDEQLKRLTDYMLKDIKGLPDRLQLIVLLLKMGELNKAEEICHTKSKSGSIDSSADALLFHYTIGLIRSMKRDQNTSLSHLKKVLEVSQTYLPADHPILAELYANIGSNYRAVGEYSTALSYNEKALEIMEKFVPSNHLDLSYIHINIGAVYRSIGKYSTALIHLEKALQIRQKSLPPNHSDLARSHDNIGEVYQLMGEYSKALVHLEKALEIQEKSLPPNHPVLAVSHNHIGTIYQSMKQYSSALTHLEKALKIQEKSLAPDHPDRATAYNDIGVIYQKIRQYSTAFSYLEKSLEIRLKCLSPNHPDLAKVYNNIGLNHWFMRNYSSALSYLKKALEIRRNALPPNHPDLAATYNNIGLVHESMGDYSTAFSYMNKALEIRQKSLPPNHPDLAMAYSNIALVCQNLGRYEEAIQYASTAVNIATRIFGPTHHITHWHHSHLNRLRRRKE